jgi:hypothetical protein
MKKLIMSSLLFPIWMCFSYSPLSPLVFAYDLPKITVEEAIRNGKVAFVARVVRLEEFKRQDAQTFVEAKLEIIDCYYGLDCKKNKFIQMRYVSETVIHGAFPVDFQVSSELLVILNHPISPPQATFTSSYKDGFDFAFVIADTFPKDYFQSNILRFLNIYHPSSVFTVTKQDIEKWTREKKRP